MAKLTAEMKKEYIEHGALECPHCESSEIFCGDMVASMDYATRKVSCKDCGGQWQEVFTLTKIK